MQRFECRGFSCIFLLAWKLQQVLTLLCSTCLWASCRSSTQPHSTFFIEKLYSFNLILLLYSPKVCSLLFLSCLNLILHLLMLPLQTVNLLLKYLYVVLQILYVHLWYLSLPHPHFYILLILQFVVVSIFINPPQRLPLIFRLLLLHPHYPFICRCLCIRRTFIRYNASIAATAIWTESPELKRRRDLILVGGIEEEVLQISSLVGERWTALNSQRPRGGSCGLKVIDWLMKLMLLLREEVGIIWEV